MDPLIGRMDDDSSAKIAKKIEATRAGYDHSPSDTKLGRLRVSVSEVEAALDHLEASDPAKEYVFKVLEIENFPLYDDDGLTLLGYETTLHGKHRGLGQFNEATWRNVSDRPFTQVGVTLASVEAILALYAANERTFYNQGGERWNSDIAYLYHNQGAGAAMTYLTTGNLPYPKQSAAAKDVFYAAYMGNREYG